MAKQSERNACRRNAAQKKPPEPPARQQTVRDIPAINLIREGWTGLRRTLKNQPTEEVRDIPAVNLIREGWAGLVRVIKDQPDPPKEQAASRDPDRPGANKERTG